MDDGNNAKRAASLITYGYRKNPDHFKQFRHPKPAQSTSPTSKAPSVASIVNTINSTISTSSSDTSSSSSNITISKGIANSSISRSISLLTSKITRDSTSRCGYNSRNIAFIT